MSRQFFENKSKNNVFKNRNPQKTTFIFESSRKTSQKSAQNSKDIVYPTVVAKAKGLKTIALTGKNGGKLKNLADISIVVPQNETFMIQELHLPVYHALCLEIEEYFWKE